MNNRINKAPLYIAGLAALGMFGLLTWAFFIASKSPEIAVPMQPSQSRACLPVGAPEYSAQQLEQADFCSPGGEYVMELSISDRNAWSVRIQESRIAFGPVGAEPVPASVVVTTPNNRYQFTLVR